MKQQQTPRVLARWAAIFRDEGDTETADAIERQLEANSRRTLNEDDADWLQRLKHHANELNRRGAHDDVVLTFAEAFRTAESALGGVHPETFDRLDDLAKSRFKVGEYNAALDDYKRLLRLAEDLYSRDELLIATIEHFVQRCLRNIRDVLGTLRLQAYMHDMSRQAQDRRFVEAAARAARMRLIARRMAGRGKRAAAVRLHGQAIALRLRHAGVSDELAYLEIQQYANDLRDAGETGRAAEMTRAVLVIRNRKAAWIDQRQELHAALTDAATCACRQGSRRSAQDASALAELIFRRTVAD